MEFIVPKFIEKEAKIVGPFTFKQSIFIGAAGGLCLLLYFVLPIFAFVIVAVILLGGAFGLAFLKIEKTSLPVFIKNFFIFLSKPKVYLWKKKSIPPKVLKKEEQVIQKDKEKSNLKVARDSKLSELLTRIETK
ncbi:unnamed protein product [marine sediment metagenome]|uniref:PrgI family protein n=1 Tax=marine sediment metagenome TaxID=412755 RepID=X1C7X6_9ZZZZ